MPTVILPPALPSTNQMRIAWSNLLETSGATITKSTETVGFEFENAYNWQPFNFWKPADGSQWLQCVLPVAAPVNYFAFYAHDFHTNLGTIKLQYSTTSGASWVDAFSIAPASSAPVYARITTPISAAYWRVLVDSTPASSLGVVAFGSDMLLPRGCWNGFSPPVFARDTKVTNSTSETGVFLGRTIIRKGSMFKLDLGPIETSFMRSDWLPFMKHAERKPFFLLWDALDFPDEAAFCWADKDVDKPKIMKTAYMETDLVVRARID